jgi:hypothetical protein
LAAVFWVLAGACQRHGAGGFVVQFTSIMVWWSEAEAKNEKNTKIKWTQAGGVFGCDSYLMFELVHTGFLLS